jgi:hypothetical protein
MKFKIYSRLIFKNPSPLRGFSPEGEINVAHLPNTQLIMLYYPPFRGDKGGLSNEKEMTYLLSYAHLRYIEPQVNPPPKAARIRMSPFLSFFSYSQIQSGIVAAVVFP